ncbi:hypothetical protein CRE_08446 [Caenorhabditis remanei]|uniref:3'-5' exonuclease domain-containing protein n=1 Tax=Caenorhabditis remanei TaxID=31234 RepID=E3N022_CAERE|nr:hypothetical protein CRE_08446 [Caenorhabditis remanei]
MVYFSRTFHFNQTQLKAIRIAMKELEQDRNLVTFGPETSLQLDKEERKELKNEKLRTLDIQQGTGMSLLKMVDDWAGVKIFKTETMSDWTVQTLRHDQLHYAAMDAIALHYINIKSDVDWSFNPAKMLNPDSTFRTPTFFNPKKPNSTQLEMLGDICDDLLEIEDVVDWMQEFDVCITLKKIRKKLEAVRTWEKEWKWDKYWKLVVERQVHCMEDIRTSRQRDRDQLDNLP